MLVVLVTEHSRGAATLFPGTLLELPQREAMALVREGVAIPAPRDAAGKETR